MAPEAPIPHHPFKEDISKDKSLGGFVGSAQTGVMVGSSANGQKSKTLTDLLVVSGDQ